MKKGYIRTLEAILGIVIIFIFVIAIMPKGADKEKVSSYIKSVQDKIINQVEYNETLRQEILDSNPQTPKQINKNIFGISNADIIEYNSTICDFSGNIVTCNPLDLYLPNKDVYAKSVMIASPTEQKVFRFYLWYK